MWVVVHVRSTLYGFTDMGYFFFKFIFCVLVGPRRSRGHKYAKDEGGQYSATLLNKGFIIWQKNTILMRDTAGNPERAR